MATIGSNVTTGTTTGLDYLDDYLNDYLDELIDGPTLEQWHRELLQQERERDYRAEKREAQLARMNTVDTVIEKFPL